MPGVRVDRGRLDSEDIGRCQPLFASIDLKTGPDTSRFANRRQDMSPNLTSIDLGRAASADRASLPASGKLTKTTKTV